MGNWNAGPRLVSPPEWRYCTPPYSLKRESVCISNLPCNMRDRGSCTGRHPTNRGFRCSTTKCERGPEYRPDKWCYVINVISCLRSSYPPPLYTRCRRLYISGNQLSNAYKLAVLMFRKRNKYAPCYFLWCGAYGLGIELWVSSYSSPEGVQLQCVVQAEFEERKSVDYVSGTWRAYYFVIL